MTTLDLITQNNYSPEILKFMALTYNHQFLSLSCSSFTLFPPSHFTLASWKLLVLRSSIFSLSALFWLHFFPYPTQTSKIYPFNHSHYNIFNFWSLVLLIPFSFFLKLCPPRLPEYCWGGGRGGRYTPQRTPQNPWPSNSSESLYISQVNSTPISLSNYLKFLQFYSSFQLHHFYLIRTL